MSVQGTIGKTFQTLWTEVPPAGKVTVFLSLLVVGAVFWFAARDSLPVLAGQEEWLPFLSALVGVTLYVMSEARTRRDRFEAKFIPDYFYRMAQAMVYLYVILSVYTSLQDQTYDLTRWGPNVTGLLVGMFILHVEKAMEGFGQRFEEVLAGVLPRSLTAKTSREKQMDLLRADHKFQDIQSQAATLSALVPDPGIRAKLLERLSKVKSRIEEGKETDLKGIQDEVEALAWEFEQLKIAARHEEVTMSELLAKLRA